MLQEELVRKNAEGIKTVTNLECGDAYAETLLFALGAFVQVDFSFVLFLDRFLTSTSPRQLKYAVARGSCTDGIHTLPLVSVSLFGNKTEEDSTSE